MNFLAHFFLSCDQPDLAVGNFLTDLLRNKEVRQLPDEVQKGVKLHRQIDTYTDNHPIVRQAIHRLYPHHHKYAPVIVDIWYDYVLANNWSTYSDQHLQGFADDMYKNVLDAFEIIPDRVRRQVTGMIEDNWLTKYAHIEGIRDTFDRMGRYVTKPEWLAGAADHLLEELPALEEEFRVFFPELSSYVADQCPC
ncbi:MAG: DUF479 domain-containing protein [Lewinella sp.]|nr:DUF479 domain-containing protein [Lewinella sp.]